jgi:cbb3-type cytochrome oxidase subunit 3
MKQLILTQFPWPWLTAVALMIFFTFFVALLVRVSRRSALPAFQAAANLPLEDEEEFKPAFNVEARITPTGVANERF